MITQEQVVELFDYREDGVFIRKTKPSFRVKIGAQAGVKDSYGYIYVMIGGKNYKVHRLVWLYHYGYMPENNIDHINRNPSDNRIENLREVSHSCNMRNTGNRRNNTSGVKGVSWCTRLSKWGVVIMVDRRSYTIGHYTDFQEAVCTRLAAEQAVGWAGCESSSPAFKYVKETICREGKNGRKNSQMF